MTITSFPCSIYEQHQAGLWYINPNSLYSVNDLTFHAYKLQTVKSSVQATKVTLIGLVYCKFVAAEIFSHNRPNKLQRGPVAFSNT